MYVMRTPGVKHDSPEIIAAAGFTIAVAVQAAFGTPIANVRGTEGFNTKHGRTTEGLRTNKGQVKDGLVGSESSVSD